MVSEEMKGYVEIVKWLTKELNIHPTVNQPAYAELLKIAKEFQMANNSKETLDGLVDMFKGFIDPMFDNTTKVENKSKTKKPNTKIDTYEDLKNQVCKGGCIEKKNTKNTLHGNEGQASPKES